MPHFQTHGLRTTTVWSSVPTGTEAKNNCAGEDHQQFTSVLCYASSSQKFSLSFKISDNDLEQTMDPLNTRLVRYSLGHRFYFKIGCDFWGQTQNLPTTKLVL
jgi:hypothetical protein